MRLEQLAARPVLGEGFRPEDAVAAGADLVPEGIEVEGVVLHAALPGDAAARALWGVASECGDSRELSWMLQLHDAWESSVGPE